MATDLPLVIENIFPFHVTVQQPNGNGPSQVFYSVKGTIMTAAITAFKFQHP